MVRTVINTVACRSARRYFLTHCRFGMGGFALRSLLTRERQSEAVEAQRNSSLLGPRRPHFEAKATNVIYLFMAGGPSQLELFSNKPTLRKLDGQAPPESFTKGRRFAFLKPDAKLLGSRQDFEKSGRCGMELSSLLPHHRRISDEVCWLRAVSTDAFNHGPAKQFMNCGFQNAGRPCLGSWTIYGLGSESANLPGFVVLLSGPRGPRSGNALWSSGFLPSTYQGVPFRTGGEPILHLKNPAGITSEAQRDFTDAVTALNRERLRTTADPEIETRIAAYETAFRMQAAAPELVEIQREPKSVLSAYGATPGKPSFANNCLLARRLVERGVRFVQLYHTDWDHHGGDGADLEKSLSKRCQEVDRASAALVTDLKQRGLLDHTLVVWGGEFGRTPMGEARGTLGRDHHIDAFTMWMAGGGVKPGFVWGETDELGLSPIQGKVHVHDLHATILHLLGFDHRRLTHRFQGRDYRLTDVHGQIIREILA